MKPLRNLMLQTWAKNARTAYSVPKYSKCRLWASCRVMGKLCFETISSCRPFRKLPWTLLRFFLRNLGWMNMDAARRGVSRTFSLVRMQGLMRSSSELRVYKVAQMKLSLASQVDSAAALSWSMEVDMEFIVEGSPARLWENRLFTALMLS